MPSTLADRAPPVRPSTESGLSAPQLQALATLSRELTDSAGLPLFLARLGSGLGTLIAFDAISLAMKAPDGRVWGLARARTSASPEPMWQELTDSASPLLEAFSQNRPVIRQAVPPAAPFEVQDTLAQLALFPSAVCVPLRGPDGPLGALGLFALAAQHYTTGDLSLMSLLAGTAENIARRLLLVDEAARADQGRLRSDRLRDELFEQIASEVLSPLTVLDRGLELLQSSVSSPEANQTREQVDELRLVAGTLTETVGNLVELQQIDDATRPVRPAIVSLDSFLRERIQARALAARLGEARMMIRCDPPTAQITTDTRLLARVVDTLLLNALRHTPRRGEVALVAVSRPRKLIVAVADTGVSIPASERESILSRGPRGDRPPSRAFGLGFARAAIEYLGGTLTVEAPPGCGSLFRMTLPLLA